MVSTIPPLTLRERNFARVRVGILEAALSADRPFSELSVREIAERAGISAGTFFNHFPTKQDVLFYFMRIWTLRAALLAGRAIREGRTVQQAIGSVFSLVSEEMSRYPRVMLELIAEIAYAIKPPRVDLSPAEKVLLFPDEPDIVSLEEMTMEKLLTEYLQIAVKRRELPANAPIESAVKVLRAIFYGVPIAAKGENEAGVRRAYQSALEMMWRGFEGGHGRGRAAASEGGR